MRTEQDVLKDFEKLGYKLLYNNSFCLVFERNNLYTLSISKQYKEYWTDGEISINMQEHKLLNELFQIWGWF